MLTSSIKVALFACFFSMHLAAPVAVRNVKIMVQVTSTADGAIPTYIAIPIAAQPLVEVVSPPAHFLHHPTTTLEPEGAKTRPLLELQVPVPIIQLVSGSINTCKRSAIPSADLDGISSDSSDC